MVLRGRGLKFSKLYLYGTILILGIILSFSLFPFLNITQNYNNPIQPPSNFNTKENKNLPMTSASSTTSYSGIGAARNIVQYGQGSFENSYINITNNENASILVPNNWKANQVTCNVSKIYDYNAKWIDENFNNGYDKNSWGLNVIEPNPPDTYRSVSFGWYNNTNGYNDSIFLKLENNASLTNQWANVNCYLNYTFNLPRSHIPYQDWYLDFDYKILYTDPNWNTAGSGSSIYAQLDVNTNSIQFKELRMTELTNNSWNSDTIVPFTAEQYNLVPPGRVSLLLGVSFGNLASYNPTGYLKLFFDNVSLRISTFAKPSQVNLTISDFTNNNEYPIQDDIGDIIGSITMNNTWEGALGGKYHYFFFTSNSTGYVYVDTTFYVNAKSQIQSRTATGLEGIDFEVENNSVSTWNAYFPVSIPGTYSENYYINFSKPLNWNVTQLINPYGTNIINEVLGTAGYGNSSLIIPTNVIEGLNGPWEVIAKSPNYIKNANLYNKLGGNWQENSTFQASEIIKINASIRTSLIPDISQTNATLVIYAPDQSIWYQETNVLIDTSGNVQFSRIEFNADNASVGEYIAMVSWDDNNSKISQIGLSILNFTINHKTILKRSQFHENKLISAFLGDYVLIKVNYTDIDTGMGIANAILNFTMDNATKITGTMTYQGGGIYLTEIRMINLERNLYNITFSARKSYYETQENLELLQIDLQLHTSLQRYAYPTLVQYNDNITVKFLYKDQNGLGISGANVKLNINSKYVLSIDYLGEGNYSVKFSSNAFKNLGTHSVTFNFSAIGYETKLNVFQFDIIEQNVNLTVSLNSQPLQENHIFPNDIFFKEQVNFSVRALGNIDNAYLSGGNVTFISNNYVTSFNESPSTVYNASFFINQANFRTGVNNVYIKFQKSNYTTEIYSFQLSIYEQDVNLEVKLNSKPIGENSVTELSFKEYLNISVRAYANAEKIYISGGVITFVNDPYKENLTESPLTFYNISILINTDNFSAGINTIYLSFHKLNYITKTFSFKLLIYEQDINLSVSLNSQKILENSINSFYFGQKINVSVRAYATVEKKYLSGGIITLTTNGFEKNLTESPNSFYNISILINDTNFEIGSNSIKLTFQQQQGYTSGVFIFTLDLKAQPLNFTVMFNSELVDEGGQVNVFFKENMSLSVRVYATVEKKYLSEGTITFINGAFEKNLTESPNTFFNSSINIQISNFNPGINSIQITFEQKGYESQVLQFRINVNKIKINVKPVNFEGTIETLADKNVKLQLNLIEELTNRSIQNATVSYNWKYGIGSLNELSPGLYEATIKIPPNIKGTYEIIISISVDSEYEIVTIPYYIVVSIPPTPNTILWAASIVLLVIAGVLSTIVVRAFIYKPIVNKKKRKFQEKIQPFKDVRNIIGINAVHKNIGVTIYSKKYSFLKNQDETLFGGFIQAIMIFGEKVSQIDEEKLLKKDKKSKDIKTLELDFKFFYILISDYEDLRIILILQKKPSERLKTQTGEVARRAYLETSDQLKQFTGVIKNYREAIDPIANELLKLDYKEPFVITDDISFFLNSKKTNKLSGMETRIINVLDVYMKEHDSIQLQDIFDLTTEKNIDIVIEAIQALINRRYLIPFNEKQSK
ncbi:MAG: hypothetical protein P8Y70_06370 [Candidatus Lokiarchaeota archaeon]